MFRYLFLLLILANFNLRAAATLQEVIDNIPPGLWNEELLERGTSSVFGSTEHNYILKSKHIENNNFKEFFTQLKLYNILQEYDPNGSWQERVCFLEPKDLRIYNELARYFFIMERLYPIKEGKFKTLQRVYLGCKNNNYNIEKPVDFAIHTPNNYFSYNQVENILSSYKTDMDQLCCDLGTLLALVHLAAKLDGFNMEVALAKGAKNYKLALLDFDRARDLSVIFTERDEKKIIPALIKTTMLEYYYPFPTAQGFKHFREGYLNVAKHLDNKSKENFYLPLAKNFFREYTSTWLRKKFSKMYAAENSLKENLFFKKLLNKKERIEKIVRTIEKNNFYIQEEDIFNLLLEDVGKIILLYGTPCAGKSTIAEKLAKKLPGNFKVIKRKETANRILSEYIRKVTGIRPLNQKQLLLMEKELSKKYKFNLMSHCKKYAILPTIDKIGKRSIKGENTIFDICLYDPEYLSILKDLNTQYVLVYCPLPELFRRKTIRKSNKNEKTSSNKNIVAGFLELYQPAKNSKALDILRREDLIDFQEAYYHFHLDKKPETAIVPKYNFGLVIDSGKNCPDTSVEAIISRLKYR